ncbi:MAG: nucleotidyl transferase AbiEii/AbiGii toxin family protein [Ignavibacteriae bacterium]|nr:nucleotidyl transferase AbiEii/AbiGii toxin family protein [Ignavibacteriota bacterium]
MQLKGKGIISHLQREALLSFSKLTDASQFYLTGGTALAEFYLGHRKSFDLDLFTAQKELILPVSRLYEEELKKISTVQIVRRFESIVELEFQSPSEATRVQMALDSPFRFEPLVDSDIGVKINNFHDLAVDKILAFFGRAEPRDAVDVFFILKKMDFKNLVQGAAQKDPGFDLYWLAIAFEKVKDFPDEINRWPVEMLKDINVKEIKSLFANLSNEVMRKITRK